MSFAGEIEDVEFFALNSDFTIRCPLPDVETWAISPIANEAGALALTYPVDGVNFLVLQENVAQDRDLNIAVGINGVLQPDHQSILLEVDGDDVDTEAVWSFSGVSTEWWLEEAVVEPKGGQPAQGEDVGDQDAHFYSLTAGAIIRTLLSEANTRGALSHINWTGFTNDVDSNGVTWSRIITLKIAPGMTLLKVLQALVEYGMCEFEMSGTVLKMYNEESRAVDRTLSNPPVVFRQGRDLTDSPRKHSVRDTATAILAAGGSGQYYTATDATALARRGRRIESYASQGNIHDLGVLTAYAQNALEGLVNGTMEKTHGLSLVGGPQPIRDFKDGDWAWSDMGAGLERLRIKSFSMSGDADGKLVGTVSLNDLIAEREAALVRRIRGIEGGSTVTGTSQARIRPEDVVDKTTPAVPAGLNVSSLAYDANGTIEAAAAANWAPVVLNSDGTSIDDLDYYVLQWRYIKPALANFNSLGQSIWKLAGIPRAPEFSWSPLVPGESIEVRVGARDKSGNYAPFSPIVIHTLAVDNIAPPVPSIPIVSQLFGSTRVEWNGLGSDGQVMPIDFRELRVYASAVNNFTPSAANFYTEMSGAGVTAYSKGAYDETIYFKFIAVDWSGNASSPSGQASGTARKAVTVDLGPEAVERANIKVAAIGNAQIEDLAVNSAKIADLSAGKITSGTVNSDVIIGGNFATALTGGRVGFNSSSFYAYSSTGVQTVRITNTGAAMLLGEIKTAETGNRFVFNPGGTAPAELRVYPNSGASNYTKMTAGTVTDGLGGSHSILKIVGSRYANDIGEPYLEMFGTRGTLGWGDTALTAPNHLARIAVDRYGPTLSGSVIKFNCEDRNVTSPDGYAEFNIPGGSIELMNTLVPGENNQLIRGTNRGVLLHGFGISSRNRSDTSDQPMYASAFYTTSAIEHKTDLMEVNPEVFSKFDDSKVMAWRYKDDITESGDDADWHIGPFSRDFRPEYVQVGPTGREYINVDTKVGVLWARMQRLIRDVKTERDALRSELARIEGRIGRPTS
jgi:hypothetical protein